MGRSSLEKLGLFVEEGFSNILSLSPRDPELDGGGPREGGGGPCEKEGALGNDLLGADPGAANDFIGPLCRVGGAGLLSDNMSTAGGRAGLSTVPVIKKVQ